MSPDAAAILAISEKVTAAFHGIYFWKKERDATKRANTEAALTSLVLAASETRQYLAAVRDGTAPKSIEAEKHLSKLWSDAGMEMLPVDSRLADTYLLKADYWSDRVGWTQAQKDETRIDEVYRLGREVLLGD